MSEKTKRITVEVPESLHTSAKTLASSQSKTIKQVVVELLKRWLEEASEDEEPHRFEFEPEFEAQGFATPMKAPASPDFILS